jgi:hypothetical protein
VARKAVWFTARVRNHPRARSYDLIRQSLLPGWDIGRDEPADGEDYRVIELVQKKCIDG